MIRAVENFKNPFSTFILFTWRVMQPMNPRVMDRANSRLLKDPQLEELSNICWNPLVVAVSVLASSTSMSCPLT